MFNNGNQCNHVTMNFVSLLQCHIQCKAKVSILDVRSSLPTKTTLKTLSSLYQFLSSDRKIPIFSPSKSKNVL